MNGTTALCTLVFTKPEGAMQLNPIWKPLTSQKETSPLDRLSDQFTASQKRRFCSPMRSSGTMRWKPVCGKYELEPPTESHYLCVPSKFRPSLLKRLFLPSLNFSAHSAASIPAHLTSS